MAPQLAWKSQYNFTMGYLGLYFDARLNADVTGHSHSRRLGMSHGSLSTVTVLVRGLVY